MTSLCPASSPLLLSAYTSPLLRQSYSLVQIPLSASSVLWLRTKNTKATHPCRTSANRKNRQAMAHEPQASFDLILGVRLEKLGLVVVGRRSTLPQ